MTRDCCCNDHWDFEIGENRVLNPNRWSIVCMRASDGHILWKNSGDFTSSNLGLSLGVHPSRGTVWQSYEDTLSDDNYFVEYDGVSGARNGWAEPNNSSTTDWRAVRLRFMDNGDIVLARDMAGGGRFERYEITAFPTNGLVIGVGSGTAGTVSRDWNVAEGDFTSSGNFRINSEQTAYWFLDRRYLLSDGSNSTLGSDSLTDKDLRNSAPDATVESGGYWYVIGAHSGGASAWNIWRGTLSTDASPWVALPQEAHVIDVDRADTGDIFVAWIASGTNTLNVRRYDPDGSATWTTTQAGSSFNRLCEIVITEDYVFVGPVDSYDLVALDKSDGSVAWQKDWRDGGGLFGAATFNDIAAFGERVYVTGNNIN